MILRCFFALLLCLLLACPLNAVGNAGLGQASSHQVLEGQQGSTSGHAALVSPAPQSVRDICNDTDRVCTLEEHLQADPNQMLRWGVALLVCGALLVMGLYHWVIFMARNKNLASLYLAAYCLLRTINSLCSGGGDWAIRLFLPHGNANTIFVVSMVSLMASFPFLQGFFYRLFPRQFPRWGLWSLIAGSVLCLVLGLVSGFADQILNLLFLYMLLVSVYSVVNLLRAWRKHESGALILLAGYVLVVLVGVNDVLYAKEVIDTLWLTPVGTLAFILCQSGLLAYRFAQAFSSAEMMSARLERQNANLQEEMAQRLCLEQKLETVSEEERRFVSRALHDGLCQELTAARLHCSLLQSADPSGGGANKEVGKLSALLESAVDQAYELSHGLWPLRQEIGDLPAALSELATKVASEHGIEISLQQEMRSYTAGRVQGEHVFLIAKEALKNIVKHAQARHVSIRLQYQDKPSNACLQLVIEDDGVGLDSGKYSPGGLGTKIMAHHAHTLGGKLSLALRPEGGTRVLLLLPCA